MPATRINPKRGGLSAESAFPGAARAGGDLPYGAEVIPQVRDASDHAVQLDGGDVAQRADGAEPASRFVAEAAPNPSPLGAVHDRCLPRLVPGRARMSTRLN